MLQLPPAKLSDAFWFQEGPGVRNTQFRNEGIKLLNVANVTKDGEIDLSKTDRHIDTQEAYGKYRHFLVDAGDLAIASSGISIDVDGLLRTRGAFVEQEHLPLCMNTSTIRFKAIKGKSDLRYLKHWLQSTEFRTQITRLVTGSAQKNFGPTHLKQIWIGLPPLPEQRRIAAILDQADALRAKRREALVKLDEMAQAIFVEMFGDPALNPKGWPFKPLSELVRDDDNINYGVIQPGDNVEDGVPLVRVGDMIAGRVNHAKLKRISSDIEADYKRSRLRGDEILVSCVGSVGTVVLTSEGERGFNIARAVARIRVGSSVRREFVAEYLRSQHVQNYFVQELRTVSQPTLNIKQIAETKVFMPPLSLQDVFSERLRGLQAIARRVVQSDVALANLFTSLQHRAFSGTL
jgi:type I restriction enzyme S subunit